MKDQKPSEMFQAIGTYISLITGGATLLALIFIPVAKWLGYAFDAPSVFALAALILLPLSYLAYQYRKQVYNIEVTGKAQRPRWFWEILTHRISHKPEQLIKGIVMVVVPSRARGNVDQLKEIHNKNDEFNLLFHILPEADSDGKINEDAGESQHHENRSLVDLQGTLESCAGIVLLDDGRWKTYEESHPKTWKVVNDWSNTFTFRPLMSIRIQGEGTLKYSWCNLNEVKLNNQALLSTLLKLAAERARAWFDQATAQRRLFLVVALTLGLALTLSVLMNILWIEQISIKSERVKFENQRLTRAVKDGLPGLDKLLMTGQADQTSLAEQFSILRKSSNPVDQGQAYWALVGVANQIKDKINVYSHGGNARVMMFAIKAVPDRADDFILVEAAATRLPIRKFDFHFNRKEANSSSIVSCAVVRRSFVYWKGEDQRSVKITKDIQMWDLDDKPLGEFNGQEWESEGSTCQYGDPPKESKDEKKLDDPHQYLLCAPVGLSNEPSVWPAGAICISSDNDLHLDEIWARQLLLKYGNLLSFFNWDRALVSQ